MPCSDYFQRNTVLLTWFLPFFWKGKKILMILFILSKNNTEIQMISIIAF